jgi:hypothetical protein
MEEHHDYFLLTYSFMRDESYALKYVILRLDNDFTLNKLIFTSPEGRVRFRSDKGVVGIEAWESDVKTRMYGGMTKNFPLPTLAGQVDRPELAHIIINNAMDAVVDEDVRLSLQHFMENPSQPEHIDVKSIQNLTFL